MSRLIDADAYAAEMRRKQNNCRAWKDSLDEGTELYARAEQSLVTFIEAALTLKSQPTIDAIPVVWLNRHKTEYLDDWGENPVTVEQALKMWQKEQEAQK